MHAICVRAGATLVAVGTESFRDPLAAARIAARSAADTDPANKQEIAANHAITCAKHGPLTFLHLRLRSS